MRAREGQLHGEKILGGGIGGNGRTIRRWRDSISPPAPGPAGLASALALTGDAAGAFAALRHFAVLGYSADLAADSDFVRLRGNEAFAELTRRLARNGEPLVASRVAFELPKRDLLTEGIAHDARDDVFFVGSVHQSKILRVTRTGAVSEFAPELPGRWAPLGLRVDRSRGALWVAAAALPQTAGSSPTDSGRSAILRYDLRSGCLTARYDAPADGAPHAIGDLVVTRGGEVYATDSRAPVLFRVPARGDTLEPFVRSPLLLSGQGLALTPDERSLYVADYSRGILRVDLRGRSVSLVEAVDSVLALGIDGLYFHRGSLVGIQNGVTPHRVARFTLSPAGDRLVRAEGPRACASQIPGADPWRAGWRRALLHRERAVGAIRRGRPDHEARVTGAAGGASAAL